MNSRQLKIGKDQSVQSGEPRQWVDCECVRRLPPLLPSLAATFASLTSSSAVPSSNDDGGGGGNGYADDADGDTMAVTKQTLMHSVTEYTHQR